MEASVRILNSGSSKILFSESHRRSIAVTLRHGNNLRYYRRQVFPPQSHPIFRNRSQIGAISGKPICSSRARCSLSLPFSNSLALGLLFSAFSSPAFQSHHYHDSGSLNLFKSDPNDDVLSGRWSGAPDPVKGSGTVNGGGGRQVTAVLLGWLGAEPKHLKRYADLYASRGINTLAFVVPVSDVLWIDLGRKVENRIDRLVNEIVAWLSFPEKDGGERILVFHTFSNTGWFTYGAILSRLQDRPDLMERIKGCVVDSGGDPELNPKVWAAGFATAMLKKRSSAAYPTSETGMINPDSTAQKLQTTEPDLVEKILLFVLEKLFAFCLAFPYINQRLTKVITSLSKNCPSCPQLYLYSTVDHVIPYRSIESFMEEQRKTGKKVWSFNFQSTPHVDHFRSFPDLYSSQVSTFLDECLAMVKQH